jgi:hypothetical protein
VLWTKQPVLFKVLVEVYQTLLKEINKHFKVWQLLDELLFEQ